MRNEKEIRAAYNDYEILKDIIEAAELEMNDTFVELIRAAFDYCLENSEGDK